MRVFALLVLALTTFAASQADATGWRRFPGPARTTRPAPAIPEPTGALLFGAGLAATVAATRRRRQP